MSDNSFYTQEMHGPFEQFALGDLVLERGGTLRNAELAFATHGQLNEARDNAVLFPVMYSGTSKHLAHYIGKGQALDPDKYFIILPNQLGNGLSTSPSNTPPPFGAGAFPCVTIGDDVRAQHRLVTEHFGIDQLQLVLGWSMGAQQTYEWAVRYPQMVKRAAPIAGTARTTHHDALSIDVFCEALTSDPAWNEGFYSHSLDVHRGLRRQARVFAMMGASQAFYAQQGWQRLGFSSREDFLRGFWEAWFLPMDPNNLLTMARKWQASDVAAHTQGDLEAALGRIQAKTYVIPFEQDMFMTLEDCQAEQDMIPASELRPIASPWGHFAMFGLFPEDFKVIDDTLKELLAS